MTVLTIHTQAGQPFFDEARNALGDPDVFRVHVTVGDKQTVFKLRHVEFKAASTPGYDSPFAVARTIPATAVLELWPDER